jgi:fatty acid desaturase
MWYAIDRAMARTVVLIALPVAVISFYYFNNPMGSSFSIPCLLHLATGWNCWGCGGQRAFHQLLHGNFQQALQLNALVYPVSALMTFALFSELTQRHPKYTFLRKKPIRISALSILIGFTILRNIL